MQPQLAQVSAALKQTLHKLVRLSLSVLLGGKLQLRRKGVIV